MTTPIKPKPTMPTMRDLSGKSFYPSGTFRRITPSVIMDARGRRMNRGNQGGLPGHIVGELEGIRPAMKISATILRDILIGITDWVENKPQAVAAQVRTLGLSSSDERSEMLERLGEQLYIHTTHVARMSVSGQRRTRPNSGKFEGFDIDSRIKKALAHIISFGLGFNISSSSLIDLMIRCREIEARYPEDKADIYQVLLLLIGLFEGQTKTINSILDLLDQAHGDIYSCQALSLINELSSNMGRQRCFGYEATQQMEAALSAAEKGIQLSPDDQGFNQYIRPFEILNLAVRDLDNRVG